jgi:hypothetical protein
LLAAAAESPHREACNALLRRAGDTSLFVAGFLATVSLASSSTSTTTSTWAVPLTGGCRTTCAARAKAARFGTVFAELAEKFRDFVDVLAEIRDSGRAGRDRRAARLRSLVAHGQPTSRAAAPRARPRAERDAQREDAPLAMLIHKLEAMLHELYALEVGYAVSDFLITDPELAHSLDSGGRKVDEKLLIAEADGEADVALYLERALLDGSTATTR